MSWFKKEHKKSCCCLDGHKVSYWALKNRDSFLNSVASVFGTPQSGYYSSSQLHIYRTGKCSACKATINSDSIVASYEEREMLIIMQGEINRLNKELETTRLELLAECRKSEVIDKAKKVSK